MSKTKIFMPFIISVFFITLLYVVSIPGCNKDDNPASNAGNPGPNEVFLSGSRFNPVSKTVAVGTTIKWINKDGNTHTVTSGTVGNPSGLFDSGNMHQNNEFPFTFTQAGTYKYFCIYHGSMGMTGTIVVQ